MTASQPSEYAHSGEPGEPPTAPHVPGSPEAPTTPQVPSPPEAPTAPGTPEGLPGSPQFLPTQPLPAGPPQPIPLQPTVPYPVPLQAPPASPTQPATPTMNGFAVASLITGVCVAVPFSVIFGIVALVQIRHTGQRGKGLAIGGLIASGLYVILGVAVAILALGAGVKRDASGVITKGGAVAVDDLHVGDCVEPVNLERNIKHVPAVPCAQPHESEVFAIFDVSGSEFPGVAQVQSQAEDGCEGRFPDYAADEDETEYSLVYFMPSSDTWRHGDRKVVCLARQQGTLVTGSIRG